ncbi:SART-1 family-domain-containing protein [Chiua virens]|nr:SART-1 family-domain-containing protein [Chiua virens]
MEESISLEETNKIRISLGLKPLSDDPAHADDADKVAEKNYTHQRDQKLLTRLPSEYTPPPHPVIVLIHPPRRTPSNGSSGRRSARRILARKRQLELENMDNLFQGDQYTEKDLEGLKVNHDFDELAEGDARILTLKDSRVLDNEEDELQNVEMAEAERTKRNQELKIKRRDYTGYDDEEFEQGNQGMKRAVLAKYDQVLEGPRETGFRLGNSITSATPVPLESDEATVSVNRALLSIDYAKNLEVHDYIRQGDVGFKKPKIKKKRNSRRVPIDNEIPGGEDTDQMEVDEKPVVPRTQEQRSTRPKSCLPRKLHVKSLQTALGNKSPMPMTSSRSKKQEGGTADSGLTFDDTSEFVRAISYNPAPVKVEQVKPSAVPPSTKTRSPSRDVSMPGDESLEEVEAGEVLVKEEDDEEMLEAIEQMIKDTEAEERANAENGEGGPVAGTSSEPTFGSGMANTMALLRQQGLLAQPNADETEREKVQRQRDFWLADYRHMLSQRDMDKLQARGGGKDQVTREYENRVREQQDARANLDLFKNYKPDVNIVYYDEFGRPLTPKEAWKALSHKFHGKGSGKMKLEKRLKKIAEEKKKEAMASGDTPLSMNKAFQIRQEKTGQAHFVLSVGNRGAVPQASEFLDPQPLSKGKTEKTKSKKKEAAKAAAPQSLDSTGFIILPAPHANDSVNASPMPSGFSSVNDSGSPVPSKPGFSRISSAVDTPSQSSTPVTERTKVAFGFGAKRKVAEDFLDVEPAAKRR